MSSIRTQARGELSRLNVIRLLAFGMLLIFPATSEAQSPPIAEQIAKTYGLDSFGQIEAIRYTIRCRATQSLALTAAPRAQQAATQPPHRQEV